MKKTGFLILSFSLLSFTIAGQITLFSKVYYGTSGSQGFTIVNDDSSGYCITGEFNSSGMFTHLDSAGGLISTKVYTLASGGIQLVKTVKTTDDLYLHLGTVTKYSPTKQSALLVKCNSSGDTIWTRRFNYGSNAQSRDVIQSADSGFVITGNLISSSSNDSVFVTRTDKNGMVLWNRSISYPALDSYSGRVKECSDSSLIVMHASTTTFVPSIFVSKLDKNGTLLWSRQYNTSSGAGPLGYDLDVRNDFIYIHYAHQTYFGFMKIDGAGNVMWQKKTLYASSFGGVYTQFARSLPLNDDGYLLVIGESNLHSATLIYRVDSLGNVMWSNGIELAMMGVVNSNDGGFTIMGNGPMYGVERTSLPSGLDQFSIQKCDSLGQASMCYYNQPPASGADNLVSTVVSPNSLNHIITPIPAGITLSNVTLTEESGCVSFFGNVNELNAREITVFPNPTSSDLTFDQLKRNDRIFIYDVSGRLITEKISEGEQLKLECGNINSGIYFYRIIDQENSPVQNGKIFIQ